MARAPTTEDVLRRLNAARDESDAGARTALLGAALEHQSPHVVAKAALLAQELGVSDLNEALCVAFHRLMRDPVETDKGCVGKESIAKALCELGIGEEAEAIFVLGIRHRQIEPAYPHAIDTAPGLRAACALGLARCDHPQALVELADLLADKIALARSAAARCIGFLGNKSAAPLLRFKIRIGDEEPDVLCDAMTALLQVGGASDLALVAAHLDSEPIIQRCAVLALGASERPDVLGLIETWLSRATDEDDIRTGTTAIAMLRQDEGFDLLIQIVATANDVAARQAKVAIESSAAHRKLASRLAEAWQARTQRPV